MIALPMAAVHVELLLIHPVSPEPSDVAKGYGGTDRLRLQKIKSGVALHLPPHFKKDKTLIHFFLRRSWRLPFNLAEPPNPAIP
jgi:hypothetical protein